MLYIPDIPATRCGCSHGGDLLPHSNAASQLPEEDSPSGVPDEQEVCGWSRVGKAWRPVHACLHRQLMLARV